MQNKIMELTSMEYNVIKNGQSDINGVIIPLKVKIMCLPNKANSCGVMAAIW